MARHPTWVKYVRALIGAALLAGLGLSSLYSYLLFHSLAEAFSIVIACSVFMLAWHARRFIDNEYLLLLGIAYLCVAGLDLVHMLAYKGMGVFPGYDADLPTQLWIAARYLQSVSLLIAPLFVGRGLRANATLAAYALLTALLLGMIFYWDAFPTCYVEGAGLTPFKKISEYVIIALLLAAAAALYSLRSRFEPGILRRLLLSIAVTAGSELAFTLYVGVYDLPNLIGHLLKIVAFYLVYTAIIEMGLGKPYALLLRDLKQRETALRKLSYAVEQSPASIVITDTAGAIEYVNPRFTQLTGYTLEEARGQNPRILKSGHTSPEEYRHLWDTITTGREWHGTFLNRKKNGEMYWEAVSIAPITDEQGAITHFIAVKEDISERVQAEERVHASLREKEVLLKEIHHRVKNNLQIISSLLNLQADYVQDEHTLSVLRESQGRIRSMALIHEKLYQSGDWARIDAADYIQSLATFLFHSYKAASEAITLQVKAEGVWLGIDAAVPCGLIINELISNALKHAFPPGRPHAGDGFIRVELRQAGSQYVLVVSDNGVGLPAGMDFRDTDSLGLELVNTLAGQLGGRLEVDRSGGTTFTLTFEA